MKKILLLMTLATTLSAAAVEHADSLVVGDTVSVPATHFTATVVEDSVGTVGLSLTIQEQVKQEYLTELTDIKIPAVIDIPRQGWTQRFIVIALQPKALSN